MIDCLNYIHINLNHIGNISCIQSFKGDDEDQAPYIIGGTVVGFTIGEIIGSKRSKTMTNENTFNLDIHPVIAQIPDHNNVMIFSIKLNFK